MEGARTTRGAIARQFETDRQSMWPHVCHGAVLHNEFTLQPALHHPRAVSSHKPLPTPGQAAGCRGPWVPNSTRLGWTTGQQAWPWGAGALGESGHRGASWVLGQSGASAVSRGGGVASGRGAHGYPWRQLDVHAPSRGPFSRASSGQSGRNIPTSGGAGDGAGQLRARLVQGPPRMTGHTGPHARLCLAPGPRLTTSPCPGLPTPVRAGMSPLPA